MRQKTIVWISLTAGHPNRCSADQLFLFTFRSKKKTQIPEIFLIDVRTGISNSYVLYA